MLAIWSNSFVANTHENPSSIKAFGECSVAAIWMFKCRKAVEYFVVEQSCNRVGVIAWGSWILERGSSGSHGIIWSLEDKVSLSHDSCCHPRCLRHYLKENRVKIRADTYNSRANMQQVGGSWSASGSPRRSWTEHHEGLSSHKWLRWSAHLWSGRPWSHDLDEVHLWRGSSCSISFLF